MVQLFHKLLGECLGLIGAFTYGSHYRAIGLQFVVVVLLSPACAGVFSSFRATRVSFIDFGLAMTRSGPLNFISVIVNNFPNFLGDFRSGFQDTSVRFWILFLIFCITFSAHKI